MRTKTEMLLKNTAIFTIGNIGSKFIQFFLVPLYTYTLSTSEYGVTELVLTAVNLLMPFFSVSIADGLLRYGLDGKYDKGTVLKNSLLLVSLGTIISIIFIPFYFIVDTLKEWCVYFLLILNLRIYRDVFAIYLKIKSKNKLFTVDSMLYTFELCGSSIIFLVLFRMGIRGYFLAYIIANILSIVFLIIAGNPLSEMKQSVLNRSLVKELFLYSLPMVLNGIAWWVTNASDRFMLKWFIDDSAVGVYSVAAKIPTFITTFTGVFNQAWIISSVIEYDNENEKEFYARTFRQYYSLLFIGAAILLSVIKPFMRIYVSKDFFEAWIYAPFLICGSIVSGIAAFTVGIYAAVRKNILIMTSTMVGAVVNITLNCILIPRIGILGAAIPTYVSWLTIAFVRVACMNRFFRFTIEYKKIISYILLTLIQCISVTYNEYVGFVVSIIVVLILAICERSMIKRLYFGLIGKN